MDANIDIEEAGGGWGDDDIIIDEGQIHNNTQMIHRYNDTQIIQ